MADDRSRPSENEHQDAESESGEDSEVDAAEPDREITSSSETDPEGESSAESDPEDDGTADDAATATSADARSDSDAESERDAEASLSDDEIAAAVERLDAEETGGAGEELDADEAADADETADAESDASEGASSENLASDDLASEDLASEDLTSEDGPEGDSGASAPESPQSDSDDESNRQTAPGDVPDRQDAPDDGDPADSAAEQTVPEDVRKYERFKKMDGAQYDRVNEFLRERTYITAREWAIARLCADFRTETGVEMTKIGENLPELVPFMTDTYTPQAVNQARSSFEGKVRQSGATFLYGAMSGFFTAEELDDMMYEVTEVAKFLLEVEGVDLSVDEELEAEDRISGVMREVQSASEQLRHDEMECPNCGHEMKEADDATPSDD